MRFVRLTVVAWLVAGSLACSGYKLESQARLSEQLGNWDDAVVQYLELVRDEPGKLSHRAALLRAKIQASHAHFERAKQYQQANFFRRALVELQQAVQLDPTNQYAFVELQKVRLKVEDELREKDALTSLDAKKERVRGALAQPPVLNPRSDEPIDLNFPEPVSVMDIYRALGKAFGINVLFDPKMRDEEIAIELKQVTAKDALEILIRTVGHFYKVLDEHSIIIVADTTQNRRTYTDLIIQTFFLSNSEVPEVMTMLRTLIDSRKVAANERLNAIILRDSADKVKVAERLIRSNDKARAEVVVDIELMQIDTNKLREVGMSLSPRQFGITLDSGLAGETGPGSSVRFSDIEFLNASNWFLTVPSFLVDFVKETSDAQTLARPQLRISEGEKASLVIADQVPIPVTRFNTGNTVGGNIVPVTSFQYQDVGITIEIEPRVHHNNEVSLKVRVVVSNIAGAIDNQPIIGTREINTTIRLKDGETNFLAGLIRTDESVTDSGIAGLSDLPLIGRLFTRKKSENKRTDIVLTLTPHIIRRADITEEDLLPIWVGTETNFSFRGGSPALASPEDGPFDVEEARERALERRRERLQQLPRGLRGVGEEDRDADSPPGGVELVPSSSPSPPSAASLGEFELKPPALEVIFPILEASEESRVFSNAPLLRGAGSLAAPPAIVVSVSPAENRVEPGDVFEVAIRVDAEQPVSHLPMVLSYDSELVELIDITEGSFLGERGQAEFLTDTSEDGRLVVGASRLGRVAGVSGEGVLLKLSFRALRIGTGTLVFEQSEALDVFLEPVEIRVTPGTIVVLDPRSRPRERLEENDERPASPEEKP